MFHGVFWTMNPIKTLRLALLAILLIGLSGSAIDLLLLGHTEGWRQWIPLVLIVSGFSALAWHGLRATALTVRVLRVVWLGFVVGGLVGVYFHYLGSVEFKLESSPGLSGWPLFWQAIQSKAPPLLAPGALAQLGLIGLAYTYRHPALGESADVNRVNQGG